VALALAASSAVAGPARADTAAISRAYDGYAATYDDLDGGAFAADTLGLDATRRALLARARGDVLELGVGTGLNLPGYDAKRVTSLTAVDISEGMLTQARKRAQGLGSMTDATTKETTTAFLSAVRFAVADAEALPFPDNSFDCVVDTFSLCVFANPEAALKEVARVLKPDGKALLVEHTRSRTVPLLGSYQDLVAGPVTKMSKGCAWNQDVEAMASRSGLRVVSAEPSLFGLLTTLEARKA
jgi:ubiquinone/menaquinone biosynthesis C-methylase UbiE